MILYFSGTGNSRYVAELIGKVTEDTVISINDILKNRKNEILKSNEPFVFVCPTYAWRIPKILEAFIKKTTFEGTKKAYFILTCGTETGNASLYVKKTCKDKGFEYMGLSSIIMPENYIAMFGVPGKEEADKIIQKSLPKILSTTEYIKKKQTLPEEKIQFRDRLRSRFINQVFYSFFVKAKGFHSKNSCISCKKCIAVCPLNNITMRNNRPNWGANCTHCMACICACPKEAIEYKNKSKGKPRYYNTEEPKI